MVFAVFLLAGMTSNVFGIPVSGQGTWETTLQGRDLDGNPATFEAWFDTVLGVTWFGDADYARTVGAPEPDGRLTWFEAQSFITSLNSSTFLGFADWRSPTTAPINGAAFSSGSSFDGSTDGGYNISSPGSAFAGSVVNEMAHLFFNTLGNTAAFDLSGNPLPCGASNTDGCLVNTGPLSNFDIGDGYWTDVYVPTGNRAWAFNPTNGRQDVVSTAYHNSTLLARTGDVVSQSIPEPTTTALMALGIAGLGYKRRKFNGLESAAHRSQPTALT